jgi:integrase
MSIDTEPKKPPHPYLEKLRERIPKKFTDVFLQNLQIIGVEYEAAEASGLRCFVKQSKSLGMRYRRPEGVPNAGKSAKLIFGQYPSVSLADARKRHSAAAEQIGRGIDPGAEKQAAKTEAKAKASDTFQAIAEKYLKREGGKLRSVDRLRYDLETYVFPRIGSLPVNTIRKSTIIDMCEDIEEQVQVDTEGRHNGKRTAQIAYANADHILNWHAKRSDDFVNPLPRGLWDTRTRARERTLADHEIVAVWNAAGTMGVFGDFVRVLLLTGARRSEAAEMQWAEIVSDLWTLPAGRNKVSRHDRPVELVRPLTPAALAIINRRPRFDGCPYVFSLEGKRPLNKFARHKRELDRRSGIVGWTLHDLRRSARTLMSRARVPTDHAERCLGHVLGGVRGIYDKFEYLDEKRRAFTALAGLIERIVNPQDNVAPFQRAAE